MSLIGRVYSIRLLAVYSLVIITSKKVNIMTHKSIATIDYVPVVGCGEVTYKHNAPQRILNNQSSTSLQMDKLKNPLKDGLYVSSNGLINNQVVYIGFTPLHATMTRRMRLFNKYHR